MIDQLSGRLVRCDVTEIAVDVHGVGYAVTIPMSTYDRLPRIGSDVQLLTHLYVREDCLQLFGFAHESERRLFRLLITVSGVGCRLALNVLSTMSVASFCRTVAQGDVKQLVRVNGLGKRSAERLVVELREKVSEIEPAAALGAPSESAALSQAAQDAVAALETLGFRSEQARKAVRAAGADLDSQDVQAEDLIRTALKALNS